ncbi:hypothetical protein Nos7524_2127 [Nostoc sp. PCC 7524]|uniref:hypothetical protein n=1 Tax=Nostoc sp. (strain ATCC 29411 / PCC 7524) TaxID=28072 RepID=UPI00029EFA06|nr:hypothetical protein [Nostoc sp. PCC 7524]AFY47977.1 hypothetical protein Nos7524_2127 [Nostoc sp. PCC 7524]
MKNSYFKFFTSTLLLLVLFDTVGLPLLSPAIAQTSNCQQQKQQDVELQINQVISIAEQSIAESKNEQAITQFNQAIAIALAANNPTVTTNLLNRLIDNDLIEYSLLGRAIKQIEPSQKKQSIQLLTSLTRLTQSLNSGYSSIKTKTFTKIANYFRIIDEPQLALSSLTQALTASQFIKGAEFQTKALTPIAQEYLALKQTAPAEKVLAQSLQFAQKIETQNPVRRTLVLEPIAATYAQLGKTERALQLAPQISHVYYRSRMLFEVVKHLAKTNQLEAAQKLAQSLETPEFKGRSLVEIALAAGNKGQEKQAAQAFAAALQAVNTDSSAVYNQALLIQTYAKGGQRDAAYTAAQPLQNIEQKAVTLGIIANEYSQAGQIQKADRIITEIIPLIQTPQALEPVGYLQNILLNSLNAKQYKLAFDLLKQTKNTDFMGRDSWFLRIADAAIKEGKIDLTLQAAQSLNQGDVEQRDRLLQKVGYAYAKNKQIERAIAITQQISNSGNSPYKIQTLALIATASGRTSQSDKLLTQATNDARKLAPQKRALGLTSVAQAFFQLENQPQGKKLLGEAIQSVFTEKDAGVRDNNLRTMAENLIAAKQYTAAFQVAQAMSTETRDYQLPDIARLIIDHGGEAIDIANTLYKTTKTPENKTRGLTTIAEAYIRARKMQSARQVLDLAFAAAKTIPNPESRVLTFGNPPDITVVDDDSDRGSSLERIALLRTQTGDYNQALVVAQAIQDKKIRERLMQQLICYK